MATASQQECRQCEGAPDLSLNLNPTNIRYQSSHKASGAIMASNRPQSAKFSKGHNIVAKDYYRGMKTDKIVAKSIEQKRAKQLGRVPNKTLLEIKNSKYKNVGEVISEQYARSQIPEANLYMIDKVVRMRGQHGRFGIDHSELLNYELEQTNRTKDDYMNLLVYKGEALQRSMSNANVAPADTNVSSILFNRLSVKDEERYSDYSQRELYGIDKSSSANKGAKSCQRNGLSYQEWVKAKDAEKRLRRKLIGQAKNEIKEELLNVAKNERDKYEKRTKAMDDWLMQKKIEEAEKVANMREIDRRDEMEKQMREEHQTNSYKEWMRLQALKKKQSRKYNKRQKQTKEDMMARQMAEHEEEQYRRRQQREYEMGQMDDGEEEEEEGMNEDEYQRQYMQEQMQLQMQQQQQQLQQEPDYNPLRYKQHQM